MKDYLVFPALSRSRWRRTLAANVTANVMRNLWAYVVIFCGHFPDGAEKFSAAVVEEESKPDWPAGAHPVRAVFRQLPGWPAR